MYKLLAVPLLLGGTYIGVGYSLRKNLKYEYVDLSKIERVPIKKDKKFLDDHIYLERRPLDSSKIDFKIDDPNFEILYEEFLKDNVPKQKMRLIFDKKNLESLRFFHDRVEERKKIILQIKNFNIWDMYWFTPTPFEVNEKYSDYGPYVIFGVFQDSFTRNEINSVKNIEDIIDEIMFSDDLTQEEIDEIFLKLYLDKNLVKTKTISRMYAKLLKFF